MIQMFVNNMKISGVENIVKRLIHDINDDGGTSNVYRFFGLDNKNNKAEMQELCSMMANKLTYCDDNIYYNYCIDFYDYEDGVLYGFYAGALIPVDNIIKDLEKIKGHLTHMKDMFG